MEAHKLRTLIMSDRASDISRLRIYRLVLPVSLPPEQHHLAREFEAAIMRCIRLSEQITDCKAWDGQ